MNKNNTNKYPLDYNLFLDNYSAHYYTGNKLESHATSLPHSSASKYPNNSQLKIHSKTSKSRSSPIKAVSSAIQQQKQDRANFFNDPSTSKNDSTYRSVSGPAKCPRPLYQKKRVPTNRNNLKLDFLDLPKPSSINNNFQNNGTIKRSFNKNGNFDYGTRRSAQFQRSENMGIPNINCIYPYYTPSYTTYPPSALHYNEPSTIRCLSERLKTVGNFQNATPDEEHIQEKYPLLTRIAIKFAQLALGTAIILFVYEPIRGNPYDKFVLQTNTEWQGLVIGIVSILDFFALLLIITICLANINFFWRQLDSIISGLGILLYLLATCLESYYAFCYPPYGLRINLVCYRIEWIIAACLSFLNIIIYTTDMILILRSGVNVL